ncbi:hypothetical protein P8C59_008378 [Phyllachora maydis]|uniref:Zinc finger protein n=1 Tax=Phyllachora maydis TaxID=1825666 RepID=A0AAD9IAE8_9PEZI|nr:hypothetical protein P8C59_008378 [Phyllachora maydis]
MGKKKRGHPDIEEIINRPWCYYCERDFEDLKLLISHQKAKHFKCDRCGKRLNTAGGLSVHMNQVHKESLSSVENALPNRQGLDIEIFGMEGVPEDVLQQHNQRLIQQYYTEQAERRAATGNPPPGTVKGPCQKKFKIETPEEVKKRFWEWRAEQDALKARGLSGQSLPPTTVDGQSTASGAGFAPPQPGFTYPPTVPGAPAFSPAQQFPSSFSPGSVPPSSASFLPSRAPNGAAPPPGATTTGLPPTRPPYYGNGGASTVDELIASASGAAPDDIDQLIRMAEAGIKPAAAATKAEEQPAEKKSRKEREKNMRMVYSDQDVSPEEKMAMLPRYAFVPEE